MQFIILLAILYRYILFLLISVRMRRIHETFIFMAEGDRY